MKIYTDSSIKIIIRGSTEQGSKFTELWQVFRFRMFSHKTENRNRYCYEQNYVEEKLRRQRHLRK